MDEKEGKGMWLTLASDAYTTAVSFVNNNYRRQWEDNQRHFNSKHHLGSKYNKASYAYKSKLFRPKTRSSSRANEAAASAAFFANMDVVSIDPMDINNAFQVASAEFQEALLQYRLTDTLPWFQICIGGFQDAQKIGVVCSMQDWLYQERTKVVNGAKRTVIVKDEPTIRLIPVENILIHPAADWIDPIQLSPYLIEMIPMYVLDVKGMMEKDDPKTGRKKWKKLTHGEIKAARKQRYDSTRQAREGDRQDKYDGAGAGEMSEYDIVWVHRNFFKVDSEEVVFYTLGTEHLLSSPVFLEEMYPQGERPYVMGTAIIETHKIFSSGAQQLGENIQKEINENVNSRLDNVKLVLNKRWFVRRGGQVDLRSLLRNVAGSVTMMNDIERDVKSESFEDVTGSSYMEQDRLNLDYDEVTGSFSSSSIQANRKMNETVGGMAMLRGDATGMKEYLIRTFGETWVEKVLKQIIELERIYETDEVIMQIAAGQSKMLQKLSQEAQIDFTGPGLLQLLQQKLRTTINVGIGATDPVSKINNFRLGLQSISQTINEDQKGIFNIEEIVKEMFGRIGYKDGQRFVNSQEDGQDPEKAQMVQAIQQLQAALESKMQELESKIKVAMIKDQGDTLRKEMDIHGELDVQRLENQGDIAVQQLQNQVAFRAAKTRDSASGN